MDWPGSNPGLRGGRPATNRLSHGMTLVGSCLTTQRFVPPLECCDPEGTAASSTNAEPDCDTCGWPQTLVCRVKQKGLKFWYINGSYEVIVKAAREICVVSHCVFLKIIRARIPHERGAPRKRGARLLQICPVGLRPALAVSVWCLNWTA
jgi:hypothetical protein